MTVKYYGHACFEMVMGGKTLLFDPFITPNPLVKDIDIKDINPDYILITHGHGDHVADVEAIAKSSGAICISNYEIVSWLGEKGIKGHPLNHGGKVDFDFGTVKYVNAIHSSVLPDGTYGGNPGGFVLWNEEICFHHAGDTALTLDMQLIPLTCPSLDFAILPVGDNFTMGYEDAAIAADYIDCTNIIGCHFDTFPYIKIDHSKALEAFKKRGKELVLPTIGEKIEITE